MSKKLKVIPFDINNFNPEYQSQSIAHQEPLEIISPVSWELNTATNVVQEQGVLGNLVTHHMPFQERTYRIDWVGSRAEINRILNYFTKNSHRHFLLGNLSGHNVVSPGILLNSKGMLASVAEKHKFPGAMYRDYLTRFHGEDHTGYNPGTMGIRIAPDSNTSNDYSFVDTDSSAKAFVFLEKGQEYLASYSKNSHTHELRNSNHLLFRYAYYRLDNEVETVKRSIILLNPGQTNYISAVDYDRVLVLDLRTYHEVRTDMAIRGILNYIPLLVYKYGTTPKLDDYEDIPNLLMPTDDHVYNIISPSVAELSINFKEITHVSE